MARMGEGDGGERTAAIHGAIWRARPRNCRGMSRDEVGGAMAGHRLRASGTLLFPPCRFVALSLCRSVTLRFSRHRHSRTTAANRCQQTLLGVSGAAALTFHSECCTLTLTHTLSLDDADDDDDCPCLPPKTTPSTVEGRRLTLALIDSSPVAPK